MRLRPGSFAWLVAHDLRLNWRRFAGMVGDLSTPAIVVSLVFGAALLHLVAWPVMTWVSPYFHGSTANAAALLGTLISILCWMTAQGLFLTTRTIYDRGDLDLLMGAPIAPAKVLAAKSVAILASSLGSLGLLLLPIANVGALVEGPSWLAAYPVLLATGLLATASGLALTMLLFRVSGPRRARLQAHLIGAVIGGAFVLAAQIVAMLPAPLRLHVMAAVERLVEDRIGVVGAVAVHCIAAMRGDVGAAVQLLCVALAAFLLVTVLLGRHFARISLEASGAPASGSTSTPGRVVWFHVTPAAALRRKEWRLLVRDPSLFAQIGLQIIYTVPLALVLLRSEALPIALAVAPTIVVITAQVAASLAWIAVSGEDAPELIATAPVSAPAVDRAKLSAIAVPVLAVAALPLALLALLSWQAALLAALYATGAATASALLNLWHPMPGNRRGMLRRHSQSKLVALVEHALAVLWAVAIVMALMGSWLTLAPIALCVIILAVVRARRPESRRTPRPQPPVSVALIPEPGFGAPAQT